MKKILLGCLFLSACQNPQVTTTSVLKNICEDRVDSLLEKDPSKTYVISVAASDLDSTDSEILDMGLYCLGYMPLVVALSVNKEDLEVFLQIPAYLFYFSGHGGATYLSTGDERIALNTNPPHAQNVILEACHVLRNPEEIASFIRPETEYLMGYTKESWDPTDSYIAYEIIKGLANGYSIPKAFYKAVMTKQKLAEAWIIYEHKGDELTEYSARSNKPYLGE